MERYLDCGNPRCEFARIRCPDCAEEQLTLLEGEGKVGYRHGEKNAELERMDDLDFIARVTSHIPVVDRIIDHLKLTFVAEKPLPEAVLQELLWEADPPAGFFPDPPVEYFS